MVAAVTAADLVAGARALIEPLTGHTDGEWCADLDETYSVRERDGARIASLSHLNKLGRRTRDEAAANCRIATAAPVMRDTIAALLDDRDALTQRIEALEAENVKLQALVRPQWFYSADTYDSDSCRYSVGDVLEEDYFWDRPQTGQHVVEISAGTPLPSIWAAVRFACECDDPDECECDNDMIVTEHASEAEARAALQADEAAQ